MNNVNWDGLRYFLAAADAGSLSSAAKNLDSNQPTVGRHIDTLEKALGTKLFLRSVRGISLTEEGQSVYEHAQQIQKSFIKIQRVAQGSDGIANGTVRLSLPEGLGQEILIPALDTFYQNFPDVKLIFNLSATTANLTQGEADIAVRLFRPEDADLVIKYLGEMKMGLYASDSYQKNYGLPGKLNDLRKHRVVTYGDQLSILPENQWLLNHSEDSLRILSSDSTVTRFKATTSGIGISLQPTVMAETNQDMIRLFKAVKLPAHKVWLVYHKDVRHISRIRAVIEFISTCLSEILEQRK